MDPTMQVLFGWLMFASPPTATSLTGTLVVIAAVIFLARRVSP